MAGFAMDIPGRTAVIREHKKSGGLVAAVFPVHQPRALFRAFDVLPVEVWGPPRVDASHSDRHLQAYTCSIVRNGLSFLLTGGLEVADLLVVPHACDSLQGLGSLLLDLIEPKGPVLPIYLPRGSGETAEAYFADELRSLSELLGAATGRSPDTGRLMDAVRAEEEADALLARLHAEGAELELDVKELYRLIRSREYLPAERFAALAREALTLRAEGPRPGAPVLLSGIVPEPMALLEVIADAGGVVAADDLACCGRRLYPPGSSSDPFRRIAESILGGPPDSTRGSSIDDRIEHLLRLSERTGARAAVFYLPKFCEPELFYLPLLRRALKKAGIASVAIEIELSDRLAGQVITRIEALMEMVS